MKNILIIHAHPEEKSFCTALKTTALIHFKNKGCEIKESDLYRMNFNPVGGKTDFLQLNDTSFFKYQMEQVNAHTHHLFVEEVKTEIEKLQWCDVLIFNFPLWWFGLPAILKGWVDRVFAMGFVYGNGKGVYESGSFKSKIALLTLTTGGPEIAYNGGKNGNLETILFPIQHGMFYFAGMRVLPPFVSYCPARKTEEERSSELNRYLTYLNNINQLKPIY